MRFHKIISFLPLYLFWKFIMTKNLKGETMKIFLAHLLLILGISRAYAGTAQIISTSVPESKDGGEGAAGGGTGRTE
jgi:hypothetical protein